MKKENYTYSFTSSKTAKEIFELLLNIEQWWSGIYEETIEGKSKQLNDEFYYKAGGGIHASTQKLVELVPDKKVTWLVTASHLTFLNDPGEWKNTKIRFELSMEEDKTIVTFTHEGLTPEIECYNACSQGWTGYLDNLKNKLK